MPAGLYVPVYVSAPDHRKTVRLAALLKADRYKVLGHLLVLWAWAMVNAEESGLIRNAVAEEIALASRWDGRAEDWVIALVGVEYLDESPDGYVIHDWSETGGKVMRELRLERERWRARHAERPTVRSTPRPPAQGGRPEVCSGGDSPEAPVEAPPEPRSKTRRDNYRDSSVGGTDRVESYPEWFEAWWKLYTILSGRGRAKAKTLTYAKRLDPEVRERLVELTRAQDALRRRAAAAGVFVAAYPDPERFIKNRGWADEYVVGGGAQQAGSTGEPAPVSDNQRLIREEMEHGDHPLWREYEAAVVAHRVAVGWTDWLAAREVAS